MGKLENIWKPRTDLVNLDSFCDSSQGFFMRDLEPMVYKLFKPNMTVVKRKFCLVATTTKDETALLTRPLKTVHSLYCK